MAIDRLEGLAPNRGCRNGFRRVPEGGSSAAKIAAPPAPRGGDMSESIRPPPAAAAGALDIAIGATTSSGNVPNRRAPAIRPQFAGQAC
jgi:hypothetical protein